MGGCVGEAWVHKALVAFENFSRKRPVPATVSSNTGGSCCSA